MAGYWPSPFFCVFMDRDGVEGNKHAKKERGQYQAILTEQAWSIKDLLYGFRGHFSCGTRRVSPKRARSSILPARVANHSAGLDNKETYSTFSISELMVLELKYKRFKIYMKFCVRTS